MSAGICGKRLGFEEIFGSPSNSPSPKRSRRLRQDSPVFPAEFVLGLEDKVSVLVGLFPSMDREVIETVLKSHDLRIDDAIKSLRALCLGNGSVGIESGLNSVLHTNSISLEGGINSVNCPEPQCDMPKDVSSWSDILVKEMKNASGWDDVRCRATRILDAFEKGVGCQAATSLKQENHTLKEQLQCFLKDNQILKRAVAIQHERGMEHEEKLKEIQQLKHLNSQYQEQVRALEFNNYTLRIHLQTAQEAYSIPGQFHP